MRNVAVLVVLILAFFVLLSDRTGKGSGKGKPSVSTEQSSGEDSPMEDLSDEYKPQDLSKYSNIQKLNEDFDYRRSKLDYQLEEEMKEFIQTHDRYGKDQEAYKKLSKHHADLRKEFHDNRMKTLQYYQDTRTSEPMNPNLR
jgi:hypothetical protein